MSSKRRFVLISGLLSVLIAVSGGVLNVALTNMKTPPAQADQRPPSTAVTTLIANRQPYCEQVIGYGKARPLTITEVSASVTGDVVWRAPELEAGTSVQAGDVLVRIDDRDLKIAVASATARWTQAKFALHQHEISLGKFDALQKIAEVELQTSTRSHDRLRELKRGSAISEEEFDASLLQLAQRQRALLELQHQAERAQPEVERAEAEVAATAATLEQTQIDLDRSSVRAPYSGFIEERTVQLGARVSPGALLFRIIDTSRIEIPVALPASEYSVVKPGSAAVVRLTEGGPVVWRGAVSRVSPMIDDRNRTFFAFLLVPAAESEPVVPAGAFVVAEIEATQHESVFVIPRTALVGDRIYVASPAGDASEVDTNEVAVIEARIPKVRRLLTDIALLDGGVEPGERIVITNVEKIGDKSRVVVINRETRRGSPTPPSL
jgi:RND family efflux transporter MFP subunit